MSDSNLHSLYEHPKYAPKQPVDGGPGGPHDGAMNARIDRLDHVVELIGADITDVKVSIGKIETQMGHVATKTWVLIGVVAVMASIIGAAWWMVQQYLGPILAHLPK